MALWGPARRRSLVGFTTAGLFVAAAVNGCGRPAEKAAQADAAPPARAAKAGDPRAEANAPLHQPFDQATHQEPPADWQRPPDTTLTGKSVGKLYTEVVRAWDGIRFVGDDGHPLKYTAAVETDLGTFEIALRPDWAPNHVRNFIALAQVGYYDGLVFERAVHEEVEPGVYLDLLEAGCPLGTGAAGYGGIGYWVKSEFNPEAAHDEGTVGACRGIEADTAACKFYVTLCKAPYLDGNYTAFGKVTKGLDVARAVFHQPVRRDDNDPELNHRPLKPVVIRKVTVRREVDNPGPG
jgi:peptidyl-prolyl cis-trans isomerase B (cyclophilin B)